jgi:lipopolysaccharide/colanic/teichoic acid biosynthesis glycosyltransferase
LRWAYGWASRIYELGFATFPYTVFFIRWACSFSIGGLALKSSRNQTLLATLKTFNHQKNLASSHAKRQSQHLRAAAVGGGLIILAYLIAVLLHDFGWATPLLAQTVVWCALPFVIAAHLLYRSAHMPAAEQRTLLLLNTLVPYLLLVLVFALMQKPYSRGAIFAVAFLTTLWFWICERHFHRQNKLQLIYLGTQTIDDLMLRMDIDGALFSAHIDVIHWKKDTSVPRCDGVLISENEVLNNQQQEQLAILKLGHVRLYSLASVAESLTGRKSSLTLSNPLWQPDGNPAYDSFKRLVDLIVVIGWAPAWIFVGILVAIAIKLDSPGPVLYSQIRAGLHGQFFRIWKFRTMVEQKNAPAQFALLNDDRITRFGHFLRKSRLDEIPQLFNVILGQMSLIGPRPEQYTFVSEFAISIPSYPYRHLVRPGITGWAQVMQGYASSKAETAVKLSYDLYYVSHYSLALDLLIMVKTIKTIFSGKGAR